MQEQVSSGTGQVGWRHKVLSHDIDEYARAQPSWSLHYQQLSMGSFVGEVHHLQLPCMRMVKEVANCATWQRGQLGVGNIGFAMPLHLNGHGTFNGQPLTSDMVMIGRGEELDLCLSAGTVLIGIAVEAELLGSLWESLYHKRMSSWIDHQVVVRARPGLGEVVRAVHQRIMADTEAAPRLLDDPAVLAQMRDAVLIEWIEALPTRITAEGLSSGEARKRVVARACEILQSRETEPLSILELCKLVGASPSKLEYCFRSVLGISPAKYMRAARLSGVRRELRQARPGLVQDIAARWGFWHMGEFAAAYRRQFGELPSQTVRRPD